MRHDQDVTKVPACFAAVERQSCANENVCTTSSFVMNYTKSPTMVNGSKDHRQQPTLPRTSSLINYMEKIPAKPAQTIKLT